jgi:hypothetical protein
MGNVPNLPVPPPSPTANWLQTIAQIFLQQIGGTDAAGTVYPGSIDTTNLRASPGFLNAQKREPYSEFAICCNPLQEGGVSYIGPFPIDVVLEGLTYEWGTIQQGIDQLALHGDVNPATYTVTCAITLQINGKDLALLTVQDPAAYVPVMANGFLLPKADFVLNGLIPAGCILSVKLAYTPALFDKSYCALADSQAFVSLAMKALHRI